MHFPDPNKLHCFQLTVTPGNILTYLSVKVIFKQQILKAATPIIFGLIVLFLNVMTVLTSPCEDMLCSQIKHRKVGLGTQCRLQELGTTHDRCEGRWWLLVCSEEPALKSQQAWLCPPS